MGPEARKRQPKDAGTSAARLRPTRFGSRLAYLLRKTHAMRLLDPNGTLAHRLEAFGLRIAPTVCRLAGIGLIIYGSALAAGLILILTGVVRPSDGSRGSGSIVAILGGVAFSMLLLGLPLLFGRGHRLLRTALPAVIAGIYGLVLTQAPVLGLALGTNGAEMVIVFILGVVYLCVVVTDRSERLAPSGPRNG